MKGPFGDVPDLAGVHDDACSPVAVASSINSAMAVSLVRYLLDSAWPQHSSTPFPVPCDSVYVIARSHINDRRGNRQAMPYLPEHECKTEGRRSLTSKSACVLPSYDSLLPFLLLCSGASSPSPSSSPLRPSYPSSSAVCPLGNYMQPPPATTSRERALWGRLHLCSTTTLSSGQVVPP